jgi:hypothetical protein
MPGKSTPNFPFAGAIFPGLSMQLLSFLDLEISSVAALACRIPKQTSNDARSSRDLQMVQEEWHKNNASGIATGIRYSMQVVMHAWGCA